MLKTFTKGYYYHNYIKSISSFKRFNATAVNPVPANSLNLKVGKIVHVEEHPNADSLFVSKVQITEDPKSQEEPSETEAGNQYLTVCSGLRKFFNADQLVNKKIIIVNNLKTSKLRGVKSEAMVLVAEKIINEGDKCVQIELINPPKSSSIGSDLVFKKLQSEMVDEPVNPSVYKKIKDLKKLAGFLDGINVNDNGLVNFKNEYFLTDPETNDEIAYTTSVFNANVR